MGHLAQLFEGGDTLEYFGDDVYLRRLDTDDRTTLLLARLKVRGCDNSRVISIIGDAIQVPEKWISYKLERSDARQGRRHDLAAKLLSLADDLNSDPDLREITICDESVIATTYSNVDELRDLHDRVLREKGAVIPSISLPSVTPHWGLGHMHMDGRYSLVIQRVEHPKLDEAHRVCDRYEAEEETGDISEKFPVPTLAEYLQGLASLLTKNNEWPDWDDDVYRPHVPRKKAASSAMRTFVALGIFGILADLVGIKARAPNEETALLTNILLNLHGSDELTANAVSALRKSERRRYWTE